MSKRNRKYEVVKQLDGYASLAEHWTGIPDMLLDVGLELGLTRTDRDVITAIQSHRWDAARPFPGYAKIAKRAWVGKKTVQRSVEKLTRLGFLRKHRRPNGGSYVYDFKCLWEVLDLIAGGYSVEDALAALREQPVRSQVATEPQDHSPEPEPVEETIRPAWFETWPEGVPQGAIPMYPIDEITGEPLEGYTDFLGRFCTPRLEAAHSYAEHGKVISRDSAMEQARIRRLREYEESDRRRREAQAAYEAEYGEDAYVAY